MKSPPLLPPLPLPLLLLRSLALYTLHTILLKTICPSVTILHDVKFLVELMEKIQLVFILDVVVLRISAMVLSEQIPPIQKWSIDYLSEWGAKREYAT